MTNLKLNKSGTVPMSSSSVTLLSSGHPIKTKGTIQEMRDSSEDRIIMPNLGWHSRYKIMLNHHEVKINEDLVNLWWYLKPSLEIEIETERIVTSDTSQIIWWALTQRKPIGTTQSLGFKSVGPSTTTKTKKLFANHIRIRWWWIRGQLQPCVNRPQDNLE